MMGKGDIVYTGDGERERNKERERESRDVIKRLFHSTNLRRESNKEEKRMRFVLKLFLILVTVT